MRVIALVLACVAGLSLIAMLVASAVAMLVTYPDY